MLFLVHALAAPLDAAAIDALLVHDGLLRPPHGDTCCGEGGITLQQVRWAELNGTPPQELVLSLQEYIGEGCAEDHHHVYDVSGAAPQAIGTLSDGGYMIFPYLQILDLDRDGVFELLAVGPNHGSGASTLAVHKVENGQVVQRSKVSLGEAYLPFDVDSDGALEIVALLRSGQDNASVRVLNVEGKPVEAPPVEAWLPQLFEHSLTTPGLHRTEVSLLILTQLMQQLHLQPPHPQRAFQAVVEQVTHVAEPDPYVSSTWWRGSSAQRRQLEQMLDSAPRANAAAALLLRTPGSREPAIGWIHERLKARLQGKTDLPRRSVLRSLQPNEAAALCTALPPLLLQGDEQARGDIAWWGLKGPPICAQATLTVLTTPGLPVQVVRAGIFAVDRAGDSAEGLETLQPYQDALHQALVRHLEGPDPVLAAEAARALPRVGSDGSALYSTLLRSTDPEVHRSILVAIAALPEPADAGVILQALKRTTTAQVRTALHGQLLRTQVLPAIRTGLNNVGGPSDYEGYHWRAVYRTASLTEPVRTLLRTDATRRLSDPAPRVRQYAAQILEAINAAPLHKVEP